MLFVHKLPKHIRITLQTGCDYNENNKDVCWINEVDSNSTLKEVCNSRCNLAVPMQPKKRKIEIKSVKDRFNYYLVVAY